MVFNDIKQTESKTVAVSTLSCFNWVDVRFGVFVVKGTEDGFLVANVSLRTHYKVSDGRKNGVVIVFSRSLDRGYGGKKIVRLVCCATIRLNGGAWSKWYDVQDEGTTENCPLVVTKTVLSTGMKSCRSSWAQGKPAFKLVVAFDMPRGIDRTC